MSTESEKTNAEKIEALNAMLQRNRASGDPIDGERALTELRDQYLAQSRVSR